MSLVQHIRTLQWIIEQPLNAGRKMQALRRWLAWQVGSRLVPGPVAVPFVDQTILMIGPGMTGLTSNIYAGLTEASDMAFALHILRADDLFVDIGANAGVYTVLAGAVGADIIAIEPVPDTYALLTRNVITNDLRKKVTTLNIGVGETNGSLRFSTKNGPMNHVLAEGESGDAIEVPIQRLDDVLGEKVPRLMKIDVEGFEVAVLRGASGVLAQPGLAAMIIEFSDFGQRYGWSRDDIERLVRHYGFVSVDYDFVSRTLTPVQPGTGVHNVIFVRDIVQLNRCLRRLRGIESAQTARSSSGLAHQMRLAIY